MRYGYARTSTVDQNPDLQRDALTAAGCERIVVEQVSGAGARPRLDALMDELKAGDVLAVWRLDRLGRSLPDLIARAGRLDALGAHLVSLTEGIDTTTPHGRLYFHMIGAMAEFERAVIVERTQAGLRAARTRGRRLGRPPALSPRQIAHARQLVKDGTRPVEVARLLNVSRATIYRALDTDP